MNVFYHKKKIFVISSVVLLGITLATPITYALYEDAKLSNMLNAEKSANATLNKRLTTVSKPKTIAEILPSGKKLSYALTEDNMNIVWWGGGSYNTDRSAITVSISDKRAIQFLTTVASDFKDKICGGGGIIDTVDFSFGILTTTGALAPNQYANCLQVLADPIADRNKEIQTEAKQVLDVTSANVQRFVQEASVK